MVSMSDVRRLEPLAQDPMTNTPSPANEQVAQLCAEMFGDGNWVENGLDLTHSVVSLRAQGGSEADELACYYSDSRTGDNMVQLTFGAARSVRQEGCDVPGVAICVFNGDLGLVALIGGSESVRGNTIFRNPLVARYLRYALSHLRS
jgi:hypothetical protein